MTSTFDNLCRMCMLNANRKQTETDKNKVKMKITQMVSIFTIQDEAKEKFNLLHLIKATIPQLKIHENDQLPKYICLECSEKIKDMYNYQLNCIKSEKKFYKLLEEEDDTFNDLNDPKDDDDDVFKTEFDDSFIEENSMKSDEELIMEEEINRAAEATEEFIESCSDLSIDFVWDDDNTDTDWDPKSMTSNMKKSKSSACRKSNTDLIDEDIFDILCDDEKTDDGGCVKDDDKFKTTSKRPAITKEMIASGVYPCPRCKRKLKTKLSFLKHQQNHEQKDMEERLYECNICTKGERPFLCSVCGKGFASSGTLKQHSFRHLEQKQFPCPDCPKSFPTKTDMLSHYDIHKAKPRNHICDVCGRGFYKPYLLKQHKMYHNNERPYACDYCDKRFVTSEKVKRHTRIHTGEKPYKCTYCERSYCQSSELMKHLRNHLGDNIYQCELCPEKLPTVKLLRSHFATHKNDDERTKAENLAALSALEMKGMYVK